MRSLTAFGEKEKQAKPTSKERTADPPQCLLSERHSITADPHERERVDKPLRCELSEAQEREIHCTLDAVIGSIIVF